MPDPCPTGTEAEFIFLPTTAAEAAESGYLEGIELVAGGLRLEAELGFQPKTPIESRGWAGVAAIAADRCGLIFLIDTSGKLWIYDPSEDRVDETPCLPCFPSPRGLAASNRSLYVASVTDAGRHRVTALARINWQIRWIWEEEGADLGDLAVDEKERLFVLDRAHAHRAVRVLDAGGRLVRTVGGTELTTPTRLALGQDRMLYVLDGQEVVRFDREGGSIQRISIGIALGPTVNPVSLTADASGILLIGDGRPITGDEEERVIHRFNPAGVLLDDPLTGYLGPAFQMIWGKQRHLFVVGERDRIIPLAPVTSYRDEGKFFLSPFDSGSDETRWHKILLEGDRPDGTQIVVRYLITNDKLTVDDLKDRPDGAWSAPWSAPITNFTDALVLIARPQGRYMALRGELATNNPLTTPTVNALTVVFPRQSYLRYLPPIYQDDPSSRALLERFLSVFETLITKLDGKIEETPSLIDPSAAPAGFLPWLSSWLAFGLDEGWSESQQRRFLAEAMTLYKQRGTREGISRSVEVITGKPPIIFEPFQLACVHDPELRKEYEEIYGGDGCHFCLLLEPWAATKPETMALVRRMVGEQVPAHTRPGMLGLRPWFHLGLHTYLGINTQLTRPEFRLEVSVLAGGETALVDLEKAGQIERRARVELDTTLT